MNLKRKAIVLSKAMPRHMKNKKKQVTFKMKRTNKDIKSRIKTSKVSQNNPRLTRRRTKELQPQMKTLKSPIKTWTPT